MKIVQHLDNDAIGKPTVERNTQIFATDISKSPEPLTREALLEKYPAVVGDKTGEMAGEHRLYHIRIDESVTPVHDEFQSLSEKR